MGDGVDNILAIKDEEASYYLAAKKTGDKNGGIYCIHDAFITRVLTLYTDGSASAVGTGGEHVITSNSIGSWTMMDFNSGVNNMPNIPGFYYMEDGVMRQELLTYLLQREITLHSMVHSLTYVRLSKLLPTQTQLL